MAAVLYCLFGDLDFLYYIRADGTLKLAMRLSIRTFSTSAIQAPPDNAAVGVRLGVCHLDILISVKNAHVQLEYHCPYGHT